MTPHSHCPREFPGIMSHHHVRVDYYDHVVDLPLVLSMRTLPLIQHSGCGTYRHLCLQSVGPLSNTVMSRQQQAWSSPASYNGSEAILQPGSSELGRVSGSAQFGFQPLLGESVWGPMDV